MMIPGRSRPTASSRILTSRYARSNLAAWRSDSLDVHGILRPFRGELVNDEILGGAETDGSSGDARGDRPANRGRLVGQGREDQVDGNAAARLDLNQMIAPCENDRVAL